MLNGGLVRAVAEQLPVHAQSDSRPRLEGAHLEIPDKLLKPTFSPSPYIARTPHTHINSPLLPGLAYWTEGESDSDISF